MSTSTRKSAPSGALAGALDPTAVAVHAAEVALVAARAERDAAVRAALADGAKLRECAERFAVSFGRVAQIGRER